MKDRHALWPRLFGVALILTLALATACSAQPTPAPAPAATAMDTGTEEPDVMIPNNGAAVKIVSPAEGATVTGTSVEVKIDVQNFTIGENGRHWHIYLDGNEVGQVEGKDTSYVLNGLTAGQHAIKVMLANSEHEQLQDGATVNITVSQ